MVSRWGWFGLGATAAFLVAGSAAAQTLPAGDTTRPQTPPTTDGVSLDPNAPLAALPDIGVAWPELKPDATEAAATQATDAAGERRYGWRIEGIDSAATPLLPDPDFYEACIRDSFAALRAVAADPERTDQVGEFIGTLTGPSADELFGLILDGRIKVQTRSVPLTDAARVHADLENRRTTGSTVLVP